MNTSLEVESRRAPALAALRRRVTGVTVTGAVQQPPVIPCSTVIPCSAPLFSRGCSTGTRARGYAYERKVGKFLRQACAAASWKLWDHQWFEYRGKQGSAETAYFQPDFVIERPGQDGILIEVKLTYVDTREQLNKYLNYLSIFGINCFPITIVRNLVPAMPEYVNDFSEIKPNSVLHLWI